MKASRVNSLGNVELPPDGAGVAASEVAAGATEAVAVARLVGVGVAEAEGVGVDVELPAPVLGWFPADPEPKSAGPGMV
jgi:hypothetical protein